MGDRKSGAEHHLELSADFRALFEASPTPLLAVRPPEWTIAAANNARLSVTNTTLAQQLGRPLFDVFPDDPADNAATGEQNLKASLERVLATKAPDTMAVQRYAVRDANGRFVDRWWFPINVPVLDSSGEVTMVIHQVEEVTEVVQLRGEAEVQDKLVREQQAVIARLRITETALRERELHLGLMVDELNHRVKNALAIVQSIVSQTLRSFDVLEAKDAIERRLLALAAAHYVITSGHWSGADLGEIIKLAAGPYSSGDGSRFELDGPDVTLPPRLAVALALVFHELATNAVKYGALSTPDGVVKVDWQVWGKNRLRLVWRETGGPPVVKPLRRGFGTRLIERSTVGMGAEAALDFDPGGLVCEFSGDLTPDETRLPL